MRVFRLGLTMWRDDWKEETLNYTDILYSLHFLWGLHCSWAYIERGRCLEFSPLQVKPGVSYFFIFLFFFLFELVTSRALEAHADSSTVVLSQSQRRMEMVTIQKPVNPKVKGGFGRWVLLAVFLLCAPLDSSVSLSQCDCKALGMGGYPLASSP